MNTRVLNTKNHTRRHQVPFVLIAASVAVLAMSALPYAGGMAALAQAAEETPYAAYSLGRAPSDIARRFDSAWNSDTVVISVGGLIENYGMLEYKLTMNAGDTIFYSWTASDEIYSEFHGHPVAAEGAVIDAMLYDNQTGAAASGILTAPMDGLHGWFFVNASFDETIEIVLTLAGQYSLEPGILTGR